MGEGPLTEAKAAGRPAWKLKAPHDAWTQGMVVSGFGHLPAAKALFLACDGGGDDGHGGRWLRTLDGVAPVSDADGKDERAAAIAFTYTGLQKLGLSPEVLATFSAPFREGMYQEDRLRRLGDRVDGKWQGTVVEGGPRWGGNTPVRQFKTGDSGGTHSSNGAGFDEREDERITTPKTVHALLVLYDKDEAAVKEWAAKVDKALAPHGVRVVHELLLDLQLVGNIGREHFGFADGLSQPIPFNESTGHDTDDCVVLTNGEPATRDRWHGVPLGEILIGHGNGHHEEAPGPVVPDDAAGRARKAGLESAGAPDGFRNFGLDGSYLVVRELQQDVAAFWTSMTDGAERIRAHDPSATHVDANWLSERIIGRSIDGHLLCPSGYLAKDEYGMPQNAFGFRRTDPHGHGCPPGSHVRRANPRDGLAPDEASALTLLDAANNHRILRRGRKYGTKVERGDPPDSEERGLLFMCLNTDIARQFEFVQQTWLLNANFATLFDETDPLVGPKGRFTIREKPLRRILDVETFIRMAGGEYFFLPSLPALRYLAAS